YQIGNMLGRGMSIDAAVKKLGQTAEGVNTIQQVHEKATKEGIYMPITHALYAVIYEDKAALGVALHLMEAGFRSDVEFVMPHDYSNAALTAQMQAAAKNSDDQDQEQDSENDSENVTNTDDDSAKNKVAKKDTANKDDVNKDKK
ncbi:MAG: hypothetical protein N2B60_04500, partial [Psychrobacter sp.]